MQSTVDLLGWQFTILLLGLTIAVSGSVITIYEPQSSGYGWAGFPLGTAIILYGTGMTLFKARILSVENLIFGLVSVAYLASWAAFLTWLASTIMG